MKIKLSGDQIAVVVLSIIFLSIIEASVQQEWQQIV
jgi:hypothetical protein